MSSNGVTPCLVKLIGQSFPLEKLGITQVRFEVVINVVLAYPEWNNRHDYVEQHCQRWQFLGTRI